MGTTHLKTDLRQELHLAPQLLQFLQLLQMNSLELEEHLSRILEENPILEREESHVLSKDFEELRQKVASLFVTGRGFEGNWVSDVLRLLSGGRRVFRGQNLYFFQFLKIFLQHVSKFSPFRM